MSILALSVKAPWAWAMFELPDAWWKDCENRAWPTEYRGPVLIHVSSTCTRDEHSRAVFDIYRVTRELGRTELIQVPPASFMHCGCIVGAVDIVDCSNRDAPWRTRHHYGFFLANRRKCKPVRCRGQERFFRPPAEVVDELRLSR